MQKGLSPIIIITTISLIIAVLIGLLFFLYKNPQIPIKPPQLPAPKLLTTKKEEPQKPSLKPLTLENIFSKDKSWLDQIPPDQKIQIIATGDVIPARVVNIQVDKYKDFTWPYLKTAEVLKSSDLTFINLETPLIADCPFINEGFKFCGSDKNVQGLTYAGIDVASLANNHAGNFGLIAINETQKLLEQNGILVTGTNGPVYKTVKDTKFAFLGYNDIGGSQQGISWADGTKIKSEIEEAKKNSDFVIVTYHWGIEYQDQPDTRQIELGHFTIDSGADLVIGNHPHWVQPIEFYKDKLITYAHGNFVFDQEWSRKTKQGVIGKYTFYNKKLIDVEYVPLLIEDYGQPHFLNDKEGEEILSNMQAQSELLTKAQR